MSTQRKTVSKPRSHSVRFATGMIMTSHPEGHFSAKNENDRTEWADKIPEMAFLIATAMNNKPLARQTTWTKKGDFLLLQIKTGHGNAQKWAIINRNPEKWEIILENKST